jgi:hypothetical protein
VWGGEGKDERGCDAEEDQSFRSIDDIWRARRPGVRSGSGSDRREATQVRAGPGLSGGKLPSDGVQVGSPSRINGAGCVAQICSPRLLMPTLVWFSLVSSVRFVLFFEVMAR